MKTLVNFRTSAGSYCVPVDATLAVRRADGLIPLPAPRPGVVGILPGDEPITVLSVLGDGPDEVLVLVGNGHTFGLLVEAVTGLSRVQEADIHVAPSGQDQALVCGVINGDDGMVLMADTAAMAARL